VPASNARVSGSAGESELPPLLGLAEVARLAGVARNVVSNWRARDLRFPRPAADLASGPVFRAEQIQRYLARRRKSMAHVISTINLKGGVGKTTTTVAIGEILAGEMNKRVLVIDLDPQTNATTMLIGENKWKKLNKAGHTLATLFQDALRSDQDPPEFDLDASLQRNVSPVSSVRGLDLLPSSLDMIDVQDRLSTVPAGHLYTDRPVDLLHKATRKLLPEYDYVLIDCPPNLGIITLNGLRVSQGYIIPTKPDVLSTYGIPQILTRVERFADGLADGDIVALGTVITMYRAGTTIHENTLRALRADSRQGKLPKLFRAKIPQGNAVAAAAEFSSSSTLRQRWGYQGHYDELQDLTKELHERAELEL
jgi:chromosome partitioning protein